MVLVGHVCFWWGSFFPQIVFGAVLCDFWGSYVCFGFGMVKKCGDSVLVWFMWSMWFWYGPMALPKPHTKIQFGHTKHALFIFNKRGPH